MQEAKDRMAARSSSIFGTGIWCLAPAIWVFAILLFNATGVAFDWISLLPQIALTAIAALGLAYYRHFQLDENVRTMFEVTLFFVVLTPPLAAMTYPLQALNFPLYDAQFAAIDDAMGFDWTAHLTWVSQHPKIAMLLSFTYHSCMLQLAVLLIALRNTQRFEQLREFAVLFVLTVIPVTVIATLFPAEGAYAFHNPTDSIRLTGDPLTGIYHLEHVRALRAGAMKSVSIMNIVGLVTFPSFHVIFAILLAWSTRGLRFVFVPSVILNVVVAISALTIGGHYLIDLIAGAAIGFAAIYLYHFSGSAILRFWSVVLAGRPIEAAHYIKARPFG
jgi:membrane-associated phospholipid phosphatase